MAWLHGNTPTGQEVKIGAILCEAMYSCNEKEEALGIAQTRWYTGIWDPKPPMNRLAGLAIPTAGTVIFDELQAAITAIVARTSRPYFIDGAGNYYTLATLCAAAFGGAGFTTAVGEPITNVDLPSEVLKSLETLAILESALCAFIHVDSKGREGEYDVTPGQGTRAAARNAVAGYGAQGPGGQYYGEYSSYHAGTATYNYYLVQEVYLKVETDVPRFSSVTDVVYQYWVMDLYTPGDVTSPSPSFRFYNISEAQFNNANVPGPEGDLVLTHTVPGVGGLTTELLDDSAWLVSVGSGTHYWFKGVSASACPFPEDTTHDECILGSSGFYIRYSGTWTYN